MTGSGPYSAAISLISNYWLKMTATAYEYFILNKATRVVMGCLHALFTKFDGFRVFLASENRCVDLHMSQNATPNAYVVHSLRKGGGWCILPNENDVKGSCTAAPVILYWSVTGHQYWFHAVNISITILDFEV